MTTLSDHELAQLMRRGDVTQENLNTLKPFFELLKANIHHKWEEISLEDGQAAKLLKFQLKTVKALEEAMIKTVKEGKSAAHKLESKK